MSLSPRLGFTDCVCKANCINRWRSELKVFGGINLPLRGLFFMDCCQIEMGCSVIITAVICHLSQKSTPAFEGISMIFLKIAPVFSVEGGSMVK